MNTPTLIRLPEVSARVGLRRTALYESIRRGDFPAPVRLTARSVAWRADQVADWIESRPSARGGAK